MLRLRIIFPLLILMYLPVFMPNMQGQDENISGLGSPEERVAGSDAQVPGTLSVSARGEQASYAVAQVPGTLSVSARGEQASYAVAQVPGTLSVSARGGQASYAVAQVPDTMSVSAHVERTSSFTPGADLVSSYIWRGSRQGSGPHIQPYIEYSIGFFTAGAWGTIDLNGYEEADLWFSFELTGGFAVGMQDYYLPDLPYFDYSAADGSHALELNLDWASDNVWLSANCIINEAGGAGSYGKDLYFEAGLSFEFFSLFMGAGNGWHTEEGSFNVCNLGLEVFRETEVTDTFTLPFTARMVFNPDREQMFVTAGISLVFGSGD